MRLIITPLAKNNAATRRRKARADRPSKANPSEAYLTCLGYAIMLTHAGEQMLPSKEAATLYRLRGQIEVLFKTFKSAGPQVGTRALVCTAMQMH